MQSFEFNCTTCQKGLRVSNESLLGQILNCPACGSMVQIPGQPPEQRWDDGTNQPPPLPTMPEEKDTVDDFGYENQSQHSSEDIHASVFESGEVPDEALPGGNWADESGKRNRLLLGTGVCGAVLLVLLVIGFMATSDDSDSIATANQNDQTSVEDASNENTAEVVEEGNTTEDTNNVTEQAEDNSSQQDESSTDGTQGAGTDDPPSEQADPENMQSDDGNEDNSDTNDRGTDPDMPTPPGLKPNTQAQSDNEQLNELLQNVAPFIGNETADVPNANDENELDIPAPPEQENTIVVPDEPAKGIDPDAAIQLQVASITFPTPILLKQFAGFMQELTNIPVTIDAVSLANAGVDINTMVRVAVSESTVAEILDNVLGAASLSWIVDGNQIVVLPSGYDDVEPIAFTYDVAELAMGNDGGDINAWQALLEKLAVGSTGDAESNWDGSKWTVTASPNVHSVIRKTASRLQSVTSGSPDAKLLLPRWVQAQTLLAQSTELDLSRGAKIQRIAAHLSKETNGNILINWNALWELGWDLNSTVPLIADKQPLKDVLDSLLTAMHLTYIPCNDDTLIVTSPIAAHSRRWVEFYKLATADEDAASEAVQLFSEHILEAHDNPDEADIHVVALGNWIAVRASPLDHHRLVEAIGLK